MQPVLGSRTGVVCPAVKLPLPAQFIKETDGIRELSTDRICRSIASHDRRNSHGPADRDAEQHGAAVVFAGGRCAAQRAGGCHLSRARRARRLVRCARPVAHAQFRRTASRTDRRSVGVRRGLMFLALPAGRLRRHGHVALCDQRRRGQGVGSGRGHSGAPPTSMVSAVMSS